MVQGLRIRIPGQGIQFPSLVGELTARLNEDPVSTSETQRSQISKCFLKWKSMHNKQTTKILNKVPSA